MTRIGRVIVNEFGNEVEVDIQEDASGVTVSLGPPGNDEDRSKLECTRVEAKTIRELLELFEIAYKKE